MAVPECLQKVLGDKQREVLDIQKIVRKDILFLDLKESSGIQVADLVVSGLRRCLRRQFMNSEHMAALLGRLMVQAQYNGSPLNLMTFVAAAERHKVAEETAQLLRIMIR